MESLIHPFSEENSALAVTSLKSGLFERLPSPLDLAVYRPVKTDFPTDSYLSVPPNIKRRDVSPRFCAEIVDP